jgi:beta-galactosidase
MTRPAQASSPIELVPEGLSLAGELVPLFAGSMHYFHHDPAIWRAGLEAMKEMGFRLLDTYVPWGVHERAENEFDFGQHDPRLSVATFVRLAGEVGLRVIIRPGPHINAELTYFGIPERVIWTKECQALSAGGKPVALPVPPLAFPVPSYASEAFHAEARGWFQAVGRELSPLVWPHGPIVLLQVDNEGAMYFRDGVYDQDYHPDAIALYRAFLEERYGTVEKLRRAFGDPGVTFFNAEPPRRLRGSAAAELARHLDWAEFQEVLVARAFERFRRGLEEAGLSGLPTSHNLPLSEVATPLDPARVGNAVELLGLDYYHGASPLQRAEIARRTSELSVRSEARGHPAFACELGAGYPPFFAPLGPEDNLFTALTALAYGLRGFNVYMAVERDRWIGAPIDREGRPRDSAEAWQKLMAALERVRFFGLRRETSVHVLVPRSLRRLYRVMHAFGPLSAAAFRVFGGEPDAACFEDALDLGSPRAVEAAEFVQALERALERADVPFSYSSDDVARHSFKTARWTFVVCPGALDHRLIERIERARGRGQAISIGPVAPHADAAFLPLARPPALSDTTPGGVPSIVPLDEAAIENAVASACEALELNRLRVEPAAIRATLHVDRRGRPRVLFLVNATHEAHVAKVDSCGASAAVDLLDELTVRASVGAFEIGLEPRTTRVFALEM